MDTTEKLKKLEKLVEIFNKENNLTVTLSYFCFEADHYNKNTNEICLSFDSLKNSSFELLAWVVAHEYQHAVQWQTDKYKMDIQKMESYFLFKRLKTLVSLIVFIIMGLVSHNSINKINEVYSLLFMAGFFCVLFLITLTLDYRYNKLNQNLENDADQFANEKIGAAADFFFNLTKKEKNPWINFFSIYYHISKSHPSNRDRNLNAARYDLNEKYFNMIKESDC